MRIIDTLEWTHDTHKWLYQLLSRLPPPVFSECVTLGESPIADTGLFAVRDIHAGEILVVEIGPRVGTEFVERLGTFGFDCVTKVGWGDASYIVSAPVNDGEGGWINHSCEPNAAMIADGVWAAIHPIIAGTEITCDYGTFETDREWTMKCRCGSAQCRGVITGDDWKVDTLRIRLGRWFAPYLKRRLKESSLGVTRRPTPDAGGAIRRRRGQINADAAD